MILRSINSKNKWHYSRKATIAKQINLDVIAFVEATFVS